VPGLQGQQGRPAARRQGRHCAHLLLRRSQHPPDERNDEQHRLPRLREPEVPKHHRHEDREVLVSLQGAGIRRPLALEDARIPEIGKNKKLIY